ncbi:hypothetical protein [Paraflavitalea speifideaquila]|uniref:hypothetical protein n=1 Tax=Paraflavitalea speifideaquila TaxID=3076558 RepID=UPI0028F0671A|nr:hypothetical protein [Paraflavitalea speifideiaquila]
MFTVIGVLKTIIMLGVLQGTIAGCLLFWSKHNRKTHRFLARLLWLISLACLDLLLFQESILYKAIPLGYYIDTYTGKYQTVSGSNTIAVKRTGHALFPIDGGPFRGMHLHKANSY